MDDPLPAHGIAPAELAERAHCHPKALKARSLARWLLEERYATEHDGLLVPTERLCDVDWVGLLVRVVDA